MEYDVAIVGGGPGGSSTARFCAQAGLDTVLIEKRLEIGAPKRCGEGISTQGLEEVGVKPDPRWAWQEMYGAFVYAPNGKRIVAREKEQIGYIMDRKVFDKDMACLAAAAGAKVHSGVRATSILKDGDQVTGFTTTSSEGDATIKAKITIAADGIETLMARWAGLKSEHMLTETCSALQYEMANVKLEDPTMLEFYMGLEIAPGGYIWVFPKGEKVANVGIGVRTKTGGSAREYLNKFIKTREGLENASIVEINAGAVPVSDQMKKLSMGGLMLVGDAAHQVNPIHGGGIAEAMLAGKTAAGIAKKAIDAGDYSEPALAEYDRTWLEGPGVKLHNLVKLRRVIENMTDDDLNFLADELSGDDVLRLVEGNKFQALTSILKKRPSLLRLLPKLL